MFDLNSSCLQNKKVQVSKTVTRIDHFFNFLISLLATKKTKNKQDKIKYFNENCKHENTLNVTKTKLKTKKVI